MTANCKRPRTYPESGQITAKIKVTELMCSVIYHMEITPLTHASCLYQLHLDNPLLVGDI